jgi:hypothetical protein
MKPMNLPTRQETDSILDRAVYQMITGKTFIGTISGLANDYKRWLDGPPHFTRKQRLKHRRRKMRIVEYIASYFAPRPFAPLPGPEKLPT